MNDVPSLTEEERQEEFRCLVGSINLDEQENYDCSIQNVWSYRKATDVRNGINIKLGNMCNGFPFELGGVPFKNSECAYISGAYASDDFNSVGIQRLVSEESNGYLCKRIYRNRPEFTVHARGDFYQYNVHWMTYVVWQKCLINNDFSNLLKQIPIEAHLIEDTTGMNRETSTFWGAKNPMLHSTRKAVTTEVAKNGVFRFKKDLEQAQMQATNAINNIGHFVGRNVMGKILKICSLSLIYGQQPPIDYSLLESKKLYLLGKLIDFPSVDDHR